MEFVWLQQLEKKGQVSAAARDRIYENCSEILKLADSRWFDQPKAESPAPKGTQKTGTSGGAKPKLKAPPSKGFPWGELAVNLISAGAGAAFPLMLGRFFANKDEQTEVKSTLADIHAVKKDVLRMPEYQKHRDKVEARIDEIARLAPSVARNKPLVLSILKEKLHSGLTTADSQNLSIIQANLTPAKTLSTLQKQASGAELADTYISVIEMAKEAGLSGKTVGKLLTNTLTMAGLSALGGLGVGTVKALIARRDKDELEKKLRDSFSEAMRVSNAEKGKRTEILYAHPEKARQAFQTLVHFAPHVALEPNAARSFMNKYIEWDDHGGVPHSNIKELSEIERNIRTGVSGSPFFSGLAEGAKTFGLSKAIEGPISALSNPLHSQLEDLVRTDIRKASRKK